MNRGQPGVVLGIDIGTTSTKVVAFNPQGEEQASAAVGYPLREPEPGHAVQDPALIVEAVLEAVAVTVKQLPGGAVAGLSFSTAMHSLLPLDTAGQPLTPALTWADTRSTAQADRLRRSATGGDLQRRTGTPLHPMSPLTKLMWFVEQQPALAERVRWWAGIKEYVLLRLCGTLVVDHSVASGTGLMDVSRMAWDDEALRLAGITSAQLPDLVPSTTVLPHLLQPAADRTGLRRETPVVVGGGDGPLASLGAGAVRPGVASCSIGTSGALRLVVDRPVADPRGQLFCYAFDGSRWVVGGAISNGGNVLDWAGAALAPDLGTAAHEELADLAAAVPVGSGGLIMLPYLVGERAPHWNPLAQGAYVGLSRGHRRAHLVRAALEGVCLQLALVLASMRSADLQVHEVRATGGFTRSTLWRQMLSDVLDLQVSFSDTPQGSALGAGLVGMAALGLIDSMDDAADLVSAASTVRPDPAAAATYAAILPVFSDLRDALLPTFTRLRQLGPRLPL